LPLGPAEAAARPPCEELPCERLAMAHDERPLRGDERYADETQENRTPEHKAIVQPSRGEHDVSG